MLEEEINKQAHLELQKILDIYKQFLSQNQITYIETLLTKPQLVSVDEDDTLYKQNQSASENIPVPEIKTPIAHGARVFNDDLIHFYPNESKNFNNEWHGILIHELFHYLVRPNNLDTKDEDEIIKLIANNNQTSAQDFNSFLTEGIVDYLTRTYGLSSYGKDFKNYNSRYGYNILLVRELLNKGLSLKDIFQLSNEEIIKVVGKENIDSFLQSILSKNNDMIKLSEDFINIYFQGHESLIINQMAYCENINDLKAMFLDYIQNNCKDNPNNNVFIAKLNNYGQENIDLKK